MKFAMGIASAAVLMAPMMNAPAVAQTHHDRTYRAQHQRHHYRRDHCKKSSGTTGLIAGGAGGALAGNALGGGTLGTIAGGVGGA